MLVIISNTEAHRLVTGI